MTPTLTAETIVEMTREVWTALLADDGSLHPADMGGSIGNEMSATVSISGAWNGTTCLTCSLPAARHAACVMFGMEDSEVSDDEVRDAIGELINVVGGNIKGILPGPTELTLPTVHDGSFSLAGQLQMAFNVTFSWMEESVVVTVWSNEP